jgi:flagellar assembly protein FliH
MSSKIYAGNDAKPAEPLAWPRVEGNAVFEAGAQDPGDPKSRLQQLERDIDRHLQEARQAGYQEGAAAGKAASAAAVKSLEERVAKTIAELAEIRPRLRRQAEADLLKLALAIARRILHRELAVDPAAMRGLIQAALERLQSQEIYRVRLHPAQEPLVRSLLESSPLARQVEFQPDPALDRGAAVFETVRGNLDASVDTQLREIEQGLADRLDRAS